MKPLPERPRVLVVTLRRLGDVLLTTPLIRSIKRAFPAATIDALVFAGTEGILSGNPDLAGVIAIPQRPRPGESVALIQGLLRRYDLALSTQTGDRPTAWAWIAFRALQIRSAEWTKRKAGSSEISISIRSRPKSRISR